MAKPRNRIRSAVYDEKSALRVLLELVHLIVLLLPNICSSIIRKLFPPKSKSLDGLVVLVTGAGGGVGRELALGFAHCGAAVACVDADLEAALDTAQEIVRDGEKSRAYRADVRRPDQVAELSRALTKEMGLVDILVINSTPFPCPPGPGEDTSESAAREAVDVCFLPHVWIIREFLPGMKQRGKGHIVSVSSMVGHSALAGSSLYSAAKWAVNGFVESVRLEVLLEGHEDIQFTIVNAAVRDSFLTKYYSMNAIQRLGTRLPDQVAAWTIAGVRRNQTHVHIPGQIYLLCILAKMLPTTVVDRALRLLSVRPKPPNKTT